ncbi:alpha/beta hydrolase [Sphingomonas sp.]|uniref:alpha/beta hydrolase n=1 Tax=Sphingomonas sp. TaxID=28214 RepID=UPI0025D4935B|nr:alpha/beta hydrolase [Sphingomonas sp.]
MKVAAKNSATRGQTALIRLWYGPMAANITASSLKNAPFTELVRATRDVVFFDYRGMGRSEPDTKCVVAPATGSTIKARLRSVLVQSRECRRQIEARGTDLDALNAATSSQDVRDIARAMNYSSYEVWGASYGSFPALDLIGRHPAGLRAAVVGVAIPPDSRNREQVSTFARGLAAMQRECNREPSCRARFPEMAASLGRAMQRLGRERLMGRSRRLTPVDLYQALLGMAAFAPDPGSLTFVPLAIETAEKGDAALVARWIDATKGDDFGIPDMANPDVAAQTTLYCSALGNRPTKPDYEAAARRYPYLALAATPTDAMDRLCNSWKISGPPRNLWRPVKSDIPVLFYSAALDTAVTNSDTVAAARLLPRSTIITVPGVGHSFSDGCLVQVEAAFLANPYGVLDRSCTANMKPIRFALHGFEAYAAEVAAH